MLIRQIVDEKLAQYSYLIGCQRTGDALLVDPQRDVDRYIALAEREGLRLVAAAETHIHADFLSGARELAASVPGLRVYLSGEGGRDWAYEWPTGDGVDAILLSDGDTFQIGNIVLRAWHTPGHTPEHMSYVVTDRGAGASLPMGIATGDFIFVNDLGRPDLLESAVGVAGAMQSAAHQLYASARLLDEVADYVQLWPGHGAGSACGKALGAVPSTTVGYERLTSPALRSAAASEAAFVAYILEDQPAPPLYFATMKRLNRVGPPLLGELPSPPRLTLEQVASLAPDGDVQIVDTRPDRREFLRGHLPGSFHAPLNRAFPTTIGSMLDPDQAVVLIVDETSLDEALRDLVRIGYDHVYGWAPLSMLYELSAAGHVLRTIESIDVDELELRRGAGPIRVLDVRGASEHTARHIPGAMNIAHTRLLSRLDAVPSDTTVYVHCAIGTRAAAAAALLARSGRQVVHVDGSFAAWQPTDSLLRR